MKLSFLKYGCKLHTGNDLYIGLLSQTKRLRIGCYSIVVGNGDRLHFFLLRELHDMEGRKIPIAAFVGMNVKVYHSSVLSVKRR